MARKNKNARSRIKPRRTRIKLKKSGPVILPTCWRLDDGISPGRLVAIAEWRDIS